MRKEERRRIARYVRRSHYRSIWRKFVRSMACVVVFCTTYALILPAITAEQQYYCGMEAHTHEETCCVQKTQDIFTCTPGQALHTHEYMCYDAVGNLICTLPELQEHIHGDSCYDSEGSPACGIPELKAHTHDALCYNGPMSMSCTLPEITSHRHNGSCISTKTWDELICPLEEHVHSATCRPDPKADLETEENWESTLDHVTLSGDWAKDLTAIAETQIGYTESIRNYDPDTGKGYTRYGAWYGVPYGSWDAMFVSFCLEYAGIPEEAFPRGADSTSWLKVLLADSFTAELVKEVPAPGSILFYGTQEYEVRAAIVTGVETLEAHTYFEIIEGDREDQVVQQCICMDDILYYGAYNMAPVRQNWIGKTMTTAEETVTETTQATKPAETTQATDAPETTAATEPTGTKATEPVQTTEPTETTQATEAPGNTEEKVLSFQWVETENYVVMVTYSAELVLPEGAELRVTEYTRDSEIFRQRCEEAGYELDWLLNIGFFLGDEELDLSDTFTVVVSSKQGQTLGGDVTHFSENGAERIDGSNNDSSTVAFASDGFSDFGGGTAVAAAEETAYQFVTVNPANLQEGVDYAVYSGSGGNYTFLHCLYNVGAKQVSGASNGNEPYSVNGSWELTLDQMGTSDLTEITWRVVKSGNQYYLVSQKLGQRLEFNQGVWLSSNGASLANTSVSGAGTKIQATLSYGTYYLQSENGTLAGTTSSSAGTTFYFAEVTQGTSSGTTNPTEPSTPTPTEPEESFVPTYPYNPPAVSTGDPVINRMRFYNFCGEGAGGGSALPGCVFKIVGSNGYTATLTSGDTPGLELPANIPDGTYTITEVSVPAGYVRDVNPVRTFTVSNGSFSGTDNIGYFINHKLEDVEANKLAEATDYANRIYRIAVDAQSHLTLYDMDPIDVRFVVDQSNSMLFPSGLDSTGKKVTLNVNGTNNVSNLEALNLDKSKMHYIIADPEGTATVWAIWHNGRTWMCQDASYYAKAMHNNTDGYESPNGEVAILPEDRSYNDQVTYETDYENSTGVNVRSNGAGLGHDLSGSSLARHIQKVSGRTSVEYELYTASDEYNRLHYLEEAMAQVICELADANPENHVSITRFTKVVDETECLIEESLGENEVQELLDLIDGIHTSGGTRQDLALQHMIESHEIHQDLDTYTVLITDGNPDASADILEQVYSDIVTHANTIKENGSVMMTVGLGMGADTRGLTTLKNIASPKSEGSEDKYYYDLQNASGLVNALKELLFASLYPTETIDIVGDVADEISDSFYPIAWIDSGADSTGRQILAQSGGKTWVLLQENEWITLDGRLTTAGASDAAGQLLKKADGTFYILWKNAQLSDPVANYDLIRVGWVQAGTDTNRQVLASDGTRDWVLLQSGDWISSTGEYYNGTPSPWNQRYYGKLTESGGTYSVSWGLSASNGANRIYYSSDYQWEGTFYVKAKEDFIGGNAIDTNKKASVTLHGAEKLLETPTVNVHLLDMNQFSSEVTVYLGDLINEEGNSPLDALKGFYEDTEIIKLISDGGDVLNAVNADGEKLKEATFTLEYAIGRPLTDDEWAKLINGEPLVLEYTYDNASSHGPVGKFTFQLEKTGIEGSNPSYDVHEATAACRVHGADCGGTPAETYTLHIRYDAYELGESGRPEENVHNTSVGPGREVGTGTTLATGIGTLVRENVHEVHVISGYIDVTKKFREGLTSEVDETFTFTLHRVEDGADTSNDVTKTITIPAGESAGSQTITFPNLRRGTYTVTEAEDPNGFYTVKQITVLDSTNSYSTPAIGESAMEVSFVMGHNVQNRNVIGRNAETDPYTGYLYPVTGVHGAAEFTNGELIYTGEVPVTKLWDDGADSHTLDAVYLVLYLNDGPALDADGRAKLLRLDASNNWQGSFEVVLADENDVVTNYAYSVREVSAVTTETGYENTWNPAILENDGETLIYYESAVEEKGVIGVTGRGYMVSYTAGANGAWTVTNHRAVEIPETGSTGTHFHYTFGGLLITAAALMYTCINGRKRRKGGR